MGGNETGSVDQSEQAAQTVVDVMHKVRPSPPSPLSSGLSIFTPFVTSF